MNRFGLRRYGLHPVSIGYDPSLAGDSAGLVVMALPTKPGGPFRVLERYQLRGEEFEDQRPTASRSSCSDTTWWTLRLTQRAWGMA